MLSGFHWMKWEPYFWGNGVRSISDYVFNKHFIHGSFSKTITAVGKNTQTQTSGHSIKRETSWGTPRPIRSCNLFSRNAGTYVLYSCVYTYIVPLWYITFINLHTETTDQNVQNSYQSKDRPNKQSFWYEQQTIWICWHSHPPNWWYWCCQGALQQWFHFRNKLSMSTL